MIAELATFALILACIVSLLAGASLFLPRLNALLPAASALSCLLVFSAFCLLIVLRVDSDFSVMNVAEHSNRALPLLYKVAGTWGNHEGSMLLWALVVTGFGVAFSRFLASNRPLMHNAIAVQSLLAAGVLGFIVVTSNPFARLFPPPFDGKMLNPLLQDIALALHPPMLYLGYVGFSAVFSLALAGLLTRRLDGAWAALIHPFLTFAWASLTVGIALGSWWAYRELGWGGYWFWDPVENASLLPWLSGTALLHSNVVLKKRGALAGWVALLSILTFGLSLIGTFLVRSGAITSVHSFASDPARGLYILFYIVLAIGAALFLYGMRIRAIVAASPMRPASREGVIVINNLFLLTACATVLIGTLYPLFSEAISGRRITVGAPYFNLTFLPLMALPLVFAGIAPFLPWKKAAFLRGVARAWPAWSAAGATALLLLAVVKQEAVLAALGLSLAAFLTVASAQWLSGSAWRQAANWPVFLGHAGAALIVIGITCVGLWSKQSELGVSVGEKVSLAGFTFTVKSNDEKETANYTSRNLLLIVEKDDKRIATLAPEHRTYKLRETTTSEAAIHSTAAYDLYAVAGETDALGKTALRLYFRPSISFLWLGALLIAAGGFLSTILSRRRV